MMMAKTLERYIRSSRPAAGISCDLTSVGAGSLKLVCVTAMKVSSFLLLVTALGVSCLVAAKHRTWPDAQSFPDPAVDWNTCGRQARSRICDPDGILSKEGADVLEGVINLIAAGEPPYAEADCQTEGLKGYEVGVALLHRLKLPSGSDDAAAVEKFAVDLHAKWGVGGSKCQSGVLLALAKKNRQLYISTGAGAQKHLTEDVLDTIIDNVKPLLKDGKFDDAVQHAVVNIGLALAGKKSEPQQPDTDWWGLVLVGSFLALFFGAACYSERNHRRARNRFRDCKALLERIKRDQASLQEGRYEVTSCPICLEDFAVEPDSNEAGDAQHDTEPEDADYRPLLGVPQADSAQGSPSKPATGKMKPASKRSAALDTKDKAGKPSRRAMVVKCGHAFCEACLSQWVEQQRKFSCPICRRDLDTGDEQPGRGSGTSYAPDSQPPCSEREQEEQQRQQQAAWQQEFPEAVLPGMQPTDYTPRLRLRPAGWQYRSASHYRIDDLTRTGLTRDQAQQLFMSDLMFRLTALRRRYPEYVSDSMARTWMQDVQHGRQLSAQQLTQLQLQDPDVRRQLARQGAHGSNSSGWGGGGGGGGSSSGGRGGSW